MTRKHRHISRIPRPSSSEAAGVLFPGAAGPRASGARSSPAGSKKPAAACPGADESEPEAEADLLTRLAAGDREAFETIFLQHWDDLRGFVWGRYRSSLDEHEAEDVASEAMLRLWRRRGQVASLRNVRGYLKAVARNLVARRFRTPKPDEVALAADPPSRDGSPRATAERNELADQLAAAIGALPSDRRTALALSRRGASCAEIGRELGRSTSAGRQMVHQARHELLSILAACGDSCVVVTGRPPEDCPARLENKSCFKALYLNEL